MESKKELNVQAINLELKAIRSVFSRLINAQDKLEFFCKPVINKILPAI